MRLSDEIIVINRVTPCTAAHGVDEPLEVGAAWLEFEPRIWVVRIPKRFRILDEGVNLGSRSAGTVCFAPNCQLGSIQKDLESG